jgi:hypothetical protein
MRRASKLSSREEHAFRHFGFAFEEIVQEEQNAVSAGQVTEGLASFVKYWVLAARAKRQFRAQDARAIVSAMQAINDVSMSQQAVRKKDKERHWKSARRATRAVNDTLRIFDEQELFGY